MYSRSLGLKSVTPHRSKYLRLTSSSVSAFQKETVLPTTAYSSLRTQLVVYRDLAWLLSLRHHQLKHGFCSCSELSSAQMPCLKPYVVALDDRGGDAFPLGSADTKRILSLPRQSALLAGKSNVYETQFWHSFAEAECSGTQDMQAVRMQLEEDYKKMVEGFNVVRPLQELVDEVVRMPSSKKQPSPSVAAETNAGVLRTTMTQLRHSFRVQTLKSFLSTCADSGMAVRGFNTLVYYVKRLSRFNPGLLKHCDVTLFNMVLRGLTDSKIADRRAKAMTVLTLMDQCQVKPNLDTVAQLFLILEPYEVVSIVHQEGLCLEKILLDGHYSLRHQKRITDAIHSVQPDICFAESPEVKNILIPYSCSLLYGLNKTDETNHTASSPGCSCSSHSQPASTSASSLNPYRGLFTRDSLVNMFREQMNTELSSSLTVRNATLVDYSKRVLRDGGLDVEIDSSEEGREHRVLYEQLMEDTQRSWRRSLYKAVQRRRKMLARSLAMTVEVNVEPYLKCISADDFADLLFEEVMLLCTLPDNYSQPVNYYFDRLGERVMERYHARLRKERNIVDKISDIYLKYLEYFLDPTLPRRYNHRQYWDICACSLYDLNPSVVAAFEPWTMAEKFSIGKLLYSIILEDVKVPSSLKVTADHELATGPPTNAFYTVYRDVECKTQEEIRMSPVLIQLLLNTSPSKLKFSPLALPMLCPPVPWHDPAAGLYLINSFTFIRLSPYATKQKQHQHLLSQQQHQLKAPVDRDSAMAAMDCLNQLGSVPWIVNKDVLEVMLAVFRDKGDEKLAIPPAPWHLPQVPKAMIRGERTDLIENCRKRYKVKRLRKETYSLWCMTLYKLSIADHFKDRILFFPHNLDFRGRVYPYPQYLNHMGDDVSRGLLSFAKAYPLGKDGLNWLKLHCINLTGLKKRDPVKGRLEFAEERMEDILDSADKPLTGRRWWTDSDKPWQTLACCIEIAKAVRSPNHEEYMCHLPVHQDGSCNGLQHYAALGRDCQGAYQVNLSVADTPQDVYSGVAALVEEKRAHDAAKGMAIARSLKGFINRKLVKQTVMTTVYGVTRYGARQQIWNHLEDTKSFPKHLCFEASLYLMRLTFQSLGQMFRGARHIQDYLTEAATLISKECLEPVRWQTPLNFPVTQPYFRQRKVSAVYADEKLLFGKRAHGFYVAVDKPDPVKQRNGFPPNFIHSLDSSHMMLTSLYCQKEGLTFASVHDCFWTHPPFVDRMNRILRQQFVALHSEPILENLVRWFLDHYTGTGRWASDDKRAMRRYVRSRLAHVPKKGDFNLSEVLSSVYFFS